MDIYKSGGEYLCHLAHSLGYKTPTEDGCVVNLILYKEEDNIIYQSSQILDREYISRNNTDEIIRVCDDEVEKKICYPWIKQNSMDTIRLWRNEVQIKKNYKHKSQRISRMSNRDIRNSKYRNYNAPEESFRMEFPIWLLEDRKRNEDVLNEFDYNFIVNNRYLSNAAIEDISTNNYENSSHKNICYVTMLRNPLNRAVSQWEYERSIDNFLPEALSFSEYLDQYLNDNFMVRSLCGTSCLYAKDITFREYKKALNNMKNMDAILIMENYEESLYLLEKKCTGHRKWSKFEMDVQKYEENKINALSDMKGKPHEWIVKLKEKHRWDNLLYTEARRTFHSSMTFHYKSYVSEFDDPDEPKDTENTKQYDNNEERYLYYKNMHDSPNEQYQNEGFSQISDIHARYISDYAHLYEYFKVLTIPSLGNNHLRIKSPSIITTSNGGHRIIFNLINDNICEGYIVSSRIDTNLSKEDINEIPIVPFDIDGDKYEEDNFYRVSEERNELFNPSRGLSLIPLPFEREISHNYLDDNSIKFTGAEYVKAINSPDGKQAYIIFNCKTKEGNSRIAIIDYNKDPTHVVLLSIRGNEMNKIEKNWAPFFVSHEKYMDGINRHKGSAFSVDFYVNRERLTDYVLHFLYRIGPTIILACPDLPTAFKEQYDSVECYVVETKTNDIKDGMIPILSDFDKDISLMGSSPLIEYQWPFYVGMVHSKVHSLKGERHGTFWQPCYRSQLIIIDMEQMLPVHLSKSIQYPNNFFDGMIRYDAEDTYNHHAISIYNSNHKWYMGIDFDEQYPVIAEIIDLDKYLNSIIHGRDNTNEKNDMTYYGNGRNAKFIKNSDGGNKDKLTIKTDPYFIHKMVNEMESAKKCSQKRMKTSPIWHRIQSKCKIGEKPSLNWTQKKIETKK